MGKICFFCKKNANRRFDLIFDQRDNTYPAMILHQHHWQSPEASFLFSTFYVDHITHGRKHAMTAPPHICQPSSFARGSYSWFPYSELPAAPVLLAFAPSRPGVHTCLCRGMLINTLCTKATSSFYPFFIHHFQIPFPDLRGHNTISVLTRVTITCAFV